MASIRQLYATLSLRAENFNNGVRKAQREASELQKTLRPMTTLTKDLGAAMTSAGKGLTAAITLPLAAIGGLAVKAATDFESSFAGVRKTVDATEAEFAQLSDGLRDLSKTIPASVNELNKIAEAAGQLGIKKEDILAFTETMAQLGVTTNLTSEQAATATAQIQNIFGAAGKDVDRFGSALVALGNAGASTERDIIEMGLRIAGAGKTIGLTQAQVLSFASALSSVGINAEAGGSAISRVFLKINDAASEGGAAIAGFAKVAGMSGAAFKTAFETNAASAVTAFIEGLGRIKAEGGNVSAAIEDLIGKNIIIKDTLLRASGAGKLLADTLAIGDKAWKENTALVDEAQKRYATFESQFQMFKNQLNDVAISLGQALLPALRSLLEVSKPAIDFLGSVARAFADAPKSVQTLIAGLLALAAAIGPILAGLGLMLSSVAGLIPTIIKLGTYLGFGAGAAGGAGLTGALSAVTAALTGPVGITVAIAAAAAALLYFGSGNETVRDTISKAWEAIKSAVSSVMESLTALWTAAAEAGKAIWSVWGDEITTLFKVQFALLAPIVSEAFNLIKTIIQAALKIITGALKAFTGLMTGDWKMFTEGIKTIWQALWNAIKTIITAPLRVVKETVEGFTKSVTDYFAKMYDKIVGNSFVPDLIDAIEREFGSLGRIMSDPARRETLSTSDSFRSMFDRILSAARDWKGTLLSVIDSVLGSLGGLNGALGSIGLPPSIHLPAGVNLPNFPGSGSGSTRTGGGSSGPIVPAGPVMIPTDIFKGTWGEPPWGSKGLEILLQGGKYAQDYWIKHFQSPFAESLKQIMDGFAAANAAGDVDSLKDHRSALVQLLSSYQSSAASFSKITNATKSTVEKAMKQLAEDFGEGLKNVFAGFDAAIKQLEGVSKAATATTATASSSSASFPRIAYEVSRLVGKAVEKVRAINDGLPLTDDMLAALTKLLTVLPAQPITSSALASTSATQRTITVPSTVSAPVHVTLQLHLENHQEFTEAIGRREVRDHIWPQILEAAKNGIGLEELTRMIKNAMQGVTATA